MTANAHRKRLPRAAWIALAVGAAALALTLTVATAHARAALPSGFYGVVPQTPLGSADFERMGQGKVGTLRTLVSWADIDRGPAADDNNWASLDQIIGGAADNGVEVLPFIFGTPRWVATDLDRFGCGSNCGIYAPKGAAALNAWSEFARDLAERYGPQGEFWSENPSISKLPIDSYQFWNEPNSRSFYRPKPKPKAYAKLVEAGAESVRAVDPSATIVLGGLPQLAGSKKAQPGSEYLAKLLKVRALKGNFDGVAIHPYGGKLNAVIEQVDLFRDAIKQGKAKQSELWITEIGAGSKKGGNPLNRGKSGQAKLLKQSFKYFKRKRNALNVEQVDWFSWMDSPTSICAWCSSSGLFGPGMTEKPSWRAFTKFTGGS